MRAPSSCRAKIGIEAGERADFHGGGTADAHVHRHRAQQQEAETVGQLDGFLLEQGENAAADVSRPGGQRVGMAQLADLRVAAHGRRRTVK